jgi:hypothetical protein
MAHPWKQKFYIELQSRKPKGKVDWSLGFLMMFFTAEII